MLKGVATIVGLLLVLGTNALAQEPRLKWVSRIEPVYPQMAKIAHIQGEVWVDLGLDPQGTIVSMLPLSGHPILLQAASDSLRKSKFACDNCSEQTTFFSVVIRFKMDDPPRAAPVPSPVASEAPRAMLGTRTSKGRSARCLYLWRCASR